MIDVRTYLEEKSAAGSKEWLRRSPRDTHSEILESVRAFQASGGFYDSDALRFVSESLAIPDGLGVQLGHEIYIAKGMLSDERCRARADELVAAGFKPLEDAEIVDGGRYEIVMSTTYVGQEAPTYGETREVRAKHNGGRFIFLPKGARSHGFVPSGPALVRDRA